MKQNKGFSLVELIVVIAVMSVLTGVGIVQIRLISAYNAKQCAANIETQLNKVQINTMARMSAELEIYQNASGLYFAKITEKKGNSLTDTVTEKQVGKSSLLITYSTDDLDTNIVTLDDANPLRIQFDRSTGAMKSQDDAGTDIGCHKIWIKQKGNNNKEYIITVYRETGKIVVTAN